MHPKKSFGVECPVARTLECIGEWWSILILRDAFQGFTRFDDFQKSLGIAPNILSRRLLHLTETGLFERRLYSKRPPRHDSFMRRLGATPDARCRRNPKPPTPKVVCLA